VLWVRSLPLMMALLFAGAAHAQVQQPTTQAEAPTRDTTFIGPDGTAYITRTIPVPTTVSLEAQKVIAEQKTDNFKPSNLAADRAASDRARERNGKVALARYPAQVTSDVIGGVPVTIVTPSKGASVSPFILINVHGGALRLDCCSLAESIPIASLMNSKVISVLYRLAPEYPFPAGVDDVVAVYRDVLKSHPPSEVVIYGTSAGAVITGEVAMRLKTVGLPQPAALGVFSGFGDFAHQGDSYSFFTGTGLGGYLMPPAQVLKNRSDYAGATKLDNPLLSPTDGDLSGLPPTLFMTSTRDWFLSGTSLFHRAMLRAGDDAELVVFEGLGHAFWVNPALPESDEAYRIAVKFFNRHLKSRPRQLRTLPRRCCCTAPATACGRSSGAQPSY
jgi:monoterpene epsilon-lactone hydrolase